MQCRGWVKVGGDIHIPRFLRILKLQENLRGKVCFTLRNRSEYGDVSVS